MGWGLEHILLSCLSHHLDRTIANCDAGKALGHELQEPAALKRRQRRRELTKQPEDWMSASRIIPDRQARVGRTSRPRRPGGFNRRASDDGSHRKAGRALSPPIAGRKRLRFGPNLLQHREGPCVGLILTLPAFSRARSVLQRL